MKKSTWVWIFMIFVFVGLSIRAYDNSKDLSCDKCTVNFKDKLVFETQYKDKLEFKIQELFEEYRDKDKCMVYWDAVQGFGVNNG